MNGILYVSLSPSICEISIPLHAETDEYVAWLSLIADFLASRFGTTPLWFAADLDLARDWAFPNDIQATLGERSVLIDDDTFHLAFAERVGIESFRRFVESGDFKTDSVLLIPAEESAEETIVTAIRQTALFLHGETSAVTLNVANTFADGFGFLWLNHKCDPVAVRSQIQTLATKYGLICKES